MTAGLLARRDPDAWLSRAMDDLERWGLVLDSDPRLPSWPSLVVERPVRGSWWADPEVHLIDDVGARLVHHPDVLHVVLVSAKLTCVHRRLWPAFTAVALASEAWKLDGMAAGARRILDLMPDDQPLHADEEGMPSSSAKENGRLMRQLEARLLCAGGNVHTARGAHVKFVIGWSAWIREREISRPAMSASDGRARLDECLDSLNREFGGRGTLPWWRRQSGTQAAGRPGFARPSNPHA